MAGCGENRHAYKTVDRSVAAGCSSAPVYIPPFDYRQLSRLGYKPDPFLQKVFRDVRNTIGGAEQMFGYFDDVNCNGKSDIVMAIDKNPPANDEKRHSAYAVVIMEYADGKLAKIFELGLPGEPVSMKLKSLPGGKEILVAGRDYNIGIKPQDFPQINQQ